MNLLYTIDKKDYITTGTTMIRPSIRAIILQNGKLAMIYSAMYQYLKFPGGGKEKGESAQETLMREVQEESGLCVLESSIQPFGRIVRIQKGRDVDLLIQDNDYYFCHVEQGIVPQHLDDYEEKEGFLLQWVSIDEAIAVNQSALETLLVEDPFYAGMIERELKVLFLLKESGL